MVRLEVGENQDRYEPENFSSWSRLIKVRAWILRFVSNCRKEEVQRRRNHLTEEEVKESEFRVFREDQRKYFVEEINMLIQGKSVSEKSLLIEMNPTMDDVVIIRANIRIVNQLLKKL